MWHQLSTWVKICLYKNSKTETRTKQWHCRKNLLLICQFCPITLGGKTTTGVQDKYNSYFWSIGAEWVFTTKAFVLQLLFIVCNNMPNIFEDLKTLAQLNLLQFTKFYKKLFFQAAFGFKTTFGELLEQWPAKAKLHRCNASDCRHFTSNYWKRENACLIKVFSQLATRYSYMTLECIVHIYSEVFCHALQIWLAPGS